MKKKLSSVITIICLFGACLLTIACVSRESEASDAELPSAAAVAAAPALTNEVVQPASVVVPEQHGSVPEQAPGGLTQPPDRPPESVPAGASPVPFSDATVKPEPAAPSGTPALAKTPKPAPATAEEPDKDKPVSLPVLNYHSIAADPDSTLMLDPDKFAKQMDYLAKEGYTPLSISDFTLILEKRKPAPPKPVLLTFDDGYADNYEHALPVLKKHGFPATIFISPGVVGQDGYYLNWEQVKEMHEAGWDIEPHGMTHPHLPQLSAARQKEEITEARRQIEERLGTTADIFCYPYGEFNKQTLAILKEERFRYAFTIQQGRTTSAQQPLQLRRIYVNGQDSLPTWIKKLG